MIQRLSQTRPISYLLHNCPVLLEDPDGPMKLSQRHVAARQVAAHSRLRSLGAHPRHFLGLFKHLNRLLQLQQRPITFPKVVQRVPLAWQVAQLLRYGTGVLKLLSRLKVFPQRLVTAPQRIVTAPEHAPGRMIQLLEK